MESPLNQPPPPFTCSYSPNLPELLAQLQVSVALTTYQAGKVIFFSPTAEGGLVQLPRSFEQPMGLGLSADRQRLALATLDELVVFADGPGLGPDYPVKPGVYDALFVPRAVYFTGQADLHDLAWGNRGLWAVNTRFSCLSLIDDRYSFTPAWQPPFISELAPEDRCHLNGMALHDGEPAYVTALAASNEAGGWRQGLTQARGVLIHVPSGETVLDGLYMPHSPRFYKGKLYLVCSGTGELLEVDLKSGQRRTVSRLQGFARGMAIHGDFMFVGLSKLRQKSSTFKDLPIAKQALHAGVVVLDLRAGAIVAHLTYETSVEEIYDVQVLPGLARPNILNHEEKEHRLALALPGATFWGQAPPNA
jgi:uncharacterized protein (TIGR03032 family)